jgi:histidine triad (HIT) family protein
MTSCVISQIVQNQIPAWIIYQDAQIICFLPKEIEVYGHTILAPKAHYSNVFTTPVCLWEQLMGVFRKLALHYWDCIGSTGVNLLHASGLSAQQSVPHLHVHLIPRFDNDALDAWPHFPSGKLYDKDELLKALQWSDNQ